MELLKKRILEDAEFVGKDVLKVDMFLNHQIDVNLLDQIGKEFYRRFADDKVSKILTIEASGIGIACMTARYFNVPVVFAKKGQNCNIGDDVYMTEIASFTKGTSACVCVSKKYVGPGDRILIIDDFLAHGSALSGLIEIINEAAADFVGAGIVIEKGFQPGGKLLRERGVRVESLALVESIGDGKITFG
ncbi:MAG: xanthine phosphoribosyltransferase [Clostridiales bacterium]|nr:xanthine phosphoribosyltransferase [Clostridiales bacterium]